jgi:ribonuclease E
MTRKRVGQGLIEAFSTTCESCGGRGIHIHSEPVTKVALEKDMEQRYVPQVHDEVEEAEEAADSTESEAAPEVADVAEVKAPAQKRRRRAVSTGVITPE